MRNIIKHNMQQYAKIYYNIAQYIIIYLEYISISHNTTLYIIRQHNILWYIIDKDQTWTAEESLTSFLSTVIYQEVGHYNAA